MNDTQKKDALKLDNQLCFPLYVCSKEVVRRYKPYLDELDLTYTQYITMMAMWEHKSLNVSALGDYLYLDSGTLTPLLKKLEQKGYVVRKRSEEDERSLIVTITPAGEELKKKAADIPQRIGKCFEISPVDSGELYRILHKLMATWK